MTAVPGRQERLAPRAGFSPLVLALLGVGVAAGVAAVAALLVVLLGALPAAPPLSPGAELEAVGRPFGEPLDQDIASAGSAAGLGPVAQAGGLPGTPIVVDVAGAVTRPGLQQLPPGARVGEAIAAAGGYAPRVDLAEAARVLNLAEPLVDGGKILVPELGIAQPSEAGAGDDGRIDLNRADQALLETLPGIGPVTAGKIIAARAEAPFRDVQDLRDRGLVGESVFEDVEALVTVG